MTDFRQSDKKHQGNESPVAGSKTHKKFSIVQKILLLALVVQVCAAGSLKAQLPPNIWNNFGSGIEGALSVSSTTFCDGTKAAVTAISSTGAAPNTIYTLTLALASAYTANAGTGSTWTMPTNNPSTMFAAGDRVFLIDMGITSGQNYDYGTVISSGWAVTGSGPTLMGYLQIQAPYVNSYIPYYSWHLTGPTFLAAQVLLVHQYTNVTIGNNGTITCDPYNGSIGGVIMFDAANTLSFTYSSGGTPLITASGKGGLGGSGGALTSALTSISGSNGGGGSAAGSGVGGDGGNGSGGTYLGTGGKAELGNALSNCASTLVHGGKGGVADFNTVFPHYGASLSNFNTSSYTSGGPYSIYIGNGGDGGNSGCPGQAGAWAGGGGGGYTTGYPGTGTPTLGSGSGPAGGLGAAGGGIVYVRASTISIGTSLAGTVVFASNGDNTDPVAGVGGNASVLGYGGGGANGGNGSNGYFDNVSAIPCGGGGQGGPGGYGPGGGFGGNGGNAGPIWLIYCTAGSNNVISANWSATGGTAGMGGTGTNTQGASGTHGAMGTPADLCTGNTCGASYGTLSYSQTYDCDCDDAFRIFVDMDNGVSGSYPSYTYSSSTNPYETVTTSANNICAVETTFVSSSCTGPYYTYYNTFNCPMATNASFFSSVAGGLGSYSLSRSEWGSGTTGYYPQSGNKDILYTNSGIGTPIASAVPSCEYNVGSDGSYGLNHDGEPGIPGNWSFIVIDDDPQTSTSANLIFGPLKVVPLDHNMSLYPNPAQDVVNVQFYVDSTEKATIRIIDLTGKEYIKLNINPGVGINNLSMGVGFLAPGAYVFCMIHDNRIEKSNFIKQ